jgi:hypothetical protein
MVKQAPRSSGKNLFSAAINSPGARKLVTTFSAVHMRLTSAWCAVRCNLILCQHDTFTRTRPRASDVKF